MTEKRTVLLQSGGTLSISAEGLDIFQINSIDRQFIFDLLASLDDYEDDCRLKTQKPVTGIAAESFAQALQKQPAAIGAAVTEHLKSGDTPLAQQIRYLTND